MTHGAETTSWDMLYFVFPAFPESSQHFQIQGLLPAALRSKLRTTCHTYSADEIEVTRWENSPAALHSAAWPHPADPFPWTWPEQSAYEWRHSALWQHLLAAR